MAFVMVILFASGLGVFLAGLRARERAMIVVGILLMIISGVLSMVLRA